MSEYTKAFEKYWRNANPDMGRLEPWQYPRLKRCAFNAWKASRRAIAHLNKSALDDREVEK